MFCSVSGTLNLVPVQFHPRPCSSTTDPSRFSYDPEPEAEEELNVQAGDYLLVWGEPVGPGGYLDAELLDGRRGLVPSHFAQRLVGDDLLEFHQAVLSTLREEEMNNAETFAADVQRLTELAEMSEGQEEESGAEGEQGKKKRACEVLTLDLETYIVSSGSFGAGVSACRCFRGLGTEAERLAVIALGR